MRRNTAFQPEREPFQDDDSLQLNNNKIRGPFSFLNPTQAHFEHVPNPKVEQAHAASEIDTTGHTGPSPNTIPSEDFAASNVTYKWTSRNNRKGRHAITVTPATDDNTVYATPPPTNSGRAVLAGIWRMLTCYPFWDVSWLVAYVFTWGSVIWVINSFFSFLPFLQPSTDFNGETTFGGGITAFIGATVFEVGSVLLMLEAVNENQSGCFGWAVEQVYDEHFRHDGGEGTGYKMRPERESCSHHHTNTSNLVGRSTKISQEKDSIVSQPLSTKSRPAQSPSTNPQPTDSSSNPVAPAPGPSSETSSSKKSWVWFPSATDLQAHYFHDLGFIACISQLLGASIFWIAGLTALPGIFDQLTTPAKINGAYWAPQVIGGAGFVVSGTLFMLETQEHWWKPAPKVLGWHIGLWNLVGGIGFTLCPIFGFSTSHWAQFQAGCSTFWGSWAFLIGSCIQWYESLEKYPVTVVKEQDQE
ncbi:Hypothetical protein R9X50_00489700 [Acrodontium crateriforme]|uniref:Integral membrane protein n=1 Tax=Acrodontium crateriforme TaxID=150365 RepID=A0AAQ3MBS8_9PEZI|nr:Hypothetical protein R9X50_00489700 [Acrodontium crateriforme]